MKRRSIRNENLQKIEAAHVLKAATYCLDHPEVRSHSKKYGVEIDGTWFTPRDLLKQASAQAGVPLIDAFMSQYDARWRERLRCLASLSTSAASRVTRKMNQALNKTWPHPARCLREFSRSTSGDAARHWCEHAGYKRFRHGVRYQVWVDVDSNGQAQPFPLNAIVALASKYSGQRSVVSKDLSTARGGKWMRRLTELGFLVS